jgi:hypothetical protein
LKSSARDAAPARTTGQGHEPQNRHAFAIAQTLHLHAPTTGHLNATSSSPSDRQEHDMDPLNSRFTRPSGLVVASLFIFLAGCGGGGLDPILGTPGAGVTPTVTLTSPAATTPVVTGVATNTRVFATFSKPMAAATLTPSSFTVACPAGATVTASVTYDAVTQVATLTPAAPLPVNTLCSASITTAARDTQGFALASNFVWGFMTGASADTTAPTVSAVAPATGASGICLTTAASATFSEPMDPASINATTFGVTDNNVAVPGTASYDVATHVASFVPTGTTGFAANRLLVATLKSGNTGVKDATGNPLAADRVWSFTTGTQPCASGVNLRSAAAFSAFGGGAGVTNQGINTVINGDVGTTAACTLITGLHDAANVYTQTPLNIGAVTGSISCAPPAPGTLASQAIATQARADALTAYNDLAALPPGGDPGAGQLGGLVLPAAVYTSAGGTFAVTSGDLTLDAQGDANAVWVFQSASALTVGLTATPRSVLLINGAQAKNVFWQVGSAARIEDGSTMVGTIIAPAGVTVSTAGQTAQTTLTGRAIGLTASVTLVNTTIVAP